jgi:hypothetical protein
MIRSAAVALAALAIFPMAGAGRAAPYHADPRRTRPSSVSMSRSA